MYFFKLPELKYAPHLSLCRALLEYAMEAWKPYRVEGIDMLERIQSQVIRCIESAKRRDFLVMIAREWLNLDLLEGQRTGAQKNMLSDILKNHDKFPSLTYSYDQVIETVTNIQTRSATKAFTCNTDHYLIGFLPHTIRELRLN